MSKPNPKVDGYVRKSKTWQQEMQELRRIILDCDLTEEVKWRVPCYTFQNRNILILARFKECCMLTFIKGSLLKDPNHVLVKPGENTQVSRVIRFNSVQQVIELESILRAYIQEAIEVEQSGVKVVLKKITEHKVPEEFQTKLDENRALKAAFAALTPGRQRAYLLYFSAAKQSKTRQSRIEKYMPRILKGKGIDD